MDNERLKRAVLNGDKDAATKMIHTALREGRWDLIELIAKAINKGAALEDNLTKLQRLELGQNYFEDYLDLSGTDITSLPDNLAVDGYLFISSNLIKVLPDNLTVGGDFRLIDTDITSLPDNLTVGGDFYIHNTGITKLPDSLKVGGHIYRDF